MPADDRLLSIDAGGYEVLDRPPGGVVTPDDPIEVIESVARAYGARWLVVERADAARALAPVLRGALEAPWIGSRAGVRGPASGRRRCRGSRCSPCARARRATTRLRGGIGEGAPAVSRAVRSAG